MQLRERMQNRKPCLGAFLGFPSPEVVEICGLVGIDVLVLDLEHGALTGSDVANLLRAANGVKLPVMVRVADNQPKLISSALDMGADGILVPMVNTHEEALQAASAAHFPPRGGRGLGIGRAANYGVGLNLAEYAKRSEDVVLAVQIETPLAVANMESIAQVDGVDMLFVGPGDLSAALGRFGDLKHENVRDAIRQVAVVAEQYGKFAGTFCATVEHCKDSFSLGPTCLFSTVESCIVNGLTAFQAGVRALR